LNDTKSVAFALLGQRMAFIVLTRKNALKTAEISGKRAKMSRFRHIKQNSIAEIVSTMESFFVLYSQFRCHPQKVNKIKFF